jgi:hypothetical protein
MLLCVDIHFEPVTEGKRQTQYRPLDAMRVGKDVMKPKQ